MKKIRLIELYEASFDWSKFPTAKDPEDPLKKVYGTGDRDMFGKPKGSSQQPTGNPKKTEPRQSYPYDPLMWSLITWNDMKTGGFRHVARDIERNQGTPDYENDLYLWDHTRVDTIYVVPENLVSPPYSVKKFVEPWDEDGYIREWVDDNEIKNVALALNDIDPKQRQWGP